MKVTIFDFTGLLCNAIEEKLVATCGTFCVAMKHSHKTACVFIYGQLT